MQTNRIKTIGTTLAIVSLLVAYTFFRSAVSRIDFLNAFDLITSNIFGELWKFVSTPTVFLGILAFTLIWRFRNSIESVFPSLRELKAGSFSALFELPTDKGADQTIAEKRTAKDMKEQVAFDNERAEETIELLGIRIINLFLDIDGKSFNVIEIIKKVEEHKLFEASAPTNLVQRQVFYDGVFRAIYGYLMRKLFTINIDENGEKATFDLKAGVQEKLKNKLEIITKPSH